MTRAFITILVVSSFLFSQQAYALVQDNTVPEGQTASSYYLLKAGEGVSIGVSSAASSIASGLSSALLNLSLAGNALSDEASDSIASTAISLKETVASGAHTAASTINTAYTTLATSLDTAYSAVQRGNELAAVSLSDIASSIGESMLSITESTGAYLTAVFERDTITIAQDTGTAGTVSSLSAPQSGTPNEQSVEQSTPPPSSTTIINNPVIERIVETERILSVGGISEDTLNTRLEQLSNKLSAQMVSLSSANSAATAQTYQVIAQTGKIDQLTNTRITTPSITGGSLTNATVDASSLSVSGASSIGSLTAGSTTLTTLTATSLNLSDLSTFTSGFLSNASSTITSGLFSMMGGASTTNLTASGTGYFDTATSTNLFSTNATLGALSANTFNLSGLGTFASGFLGNASSTITSGLFSMMGGASTTNLTASGTGYFGLGQFTNTTGTTTIATGQGFTIGSSQFVVQQGSGNVGIGATAPGYKLQVNGSIWGGFADNDTPNAGDGTLIGGAGYWSLRPATNHSFNLDMYNGGSQFAALTVLQSGNIGIGTTNPGAYKLNVNGTLAVSDTATFAHNPSGSTVATAISATATSNNLGTASIGIIGTGTNAQGSSGIGVKGISSAFSYSHGGAGIGVYGIGSFNTNGSNLLSIGVKGEVGGTGGNEGTGVSTYAGYFINSSPSVVGFSNWGVYAQNEDTNDYALYCNAVNNASGCGGNRAWTNASDARLKENITTIPNALETVSHLRGVNFTWRQGGQTDTGFIAQEVLPYFPQVVSVGSDGYYGMKTGSLTGLLVEAVKELNTRTSFISSATTTNILTVDASGNIGIGTTTPNHTLTVAGDIGAFAFVNTSTRESKTDITEIATTTEDTILTQLQTTNVYSYHYKDEPDTNPLRMGLIVDSAPTEVLSVNGDGVDIYQLAAFTLAGVKAQGRQIEALNLNLEAISGTPTPTLESQSFAERFFSNIFTRVTEWLADAGNGIGELYAKIIHSDAVYTKEICVSKSDGTNVCVTGDQLASILAGQAASAASATASSTPDTSSSATATQDTEAPVITLNGNNPATIDIGTTYGDLGAIVTDNVSQNLGISASVDGGATTTPEQITIDTSTAATHAILYSATDQAGNTGTATRTVIVVAPAPMVVADPVATSTSATSTTP